MVKFVELDENGEIGVGDVGRVLTTTALILAQTNARFEYANYPVFQIPFSV